jgi:hypothetical protein
VTRLPGAQGVTLVGFYGSSLRFVDLGTGRIRLLLLHDVTAPITRVIALDDAVVVVSSYSVYAVRHLNTSHPNVFEIPHDAVPAEDIARSVFRSTRSDRFWIAQAPYDVWEIRTDGHAVGHYLLPDGFRAIAAVEGDRLVVESFPNLSIWDPRSRRFGRRIGTGRRPFPIGAGSHFVVWRDQGQVNCGSDCDAIFTDTRTGLDRVLPSGVSAIFGSETLSFSPNGNRAAISSYRSLANGPMPRVTVVDVPSLRQTWSYEIGALTQILDVTWSPSGRWLLFEDSTGQTAHRLADRGVIRIRWPDVQFRGVAILSSP